MSDTNRVRKAANILIIIGMSVVFLIYAKNFVIPLILAIVLWYLINAINTAIRKWKPIKKLPEALTLAISSVFVLFVMFLFGRLVFQNIQGLINESPEYRANLEHQIRSVVNSWGFGSQVDVDSIMENLNVSNYLGSIVSSAGQIASRFLLVLLYTLFMLLEQSTFTRKILFMGMDEDRKDSLFKIFEEINKSVRTYIGVKFAASFATGLLSYIVIKFAGLDFALFWAFIIFVFNFIPTFGSIVATLFPTFVALIQFDTLTPFLTILIGVGIIQVIIGGIMEPRLYGNSLNLSPLVIVISLVLWGTLWGVVGMLLCVPITVILIQIFAQFDNTRHVAVLLSRSGRIRGRGRNKNKSQ